MYTFMYTHIYADIHATQTYRYGEQKPCSQTQANVHVDYWAEKQGEGRESKRVCMGKCYVFTMHMYTNCIYIYTDVITEKLKCNVHMYVHVHV